MELQQWIPNIRLFFSSIPFVDNGALVPGYDVLCAYLFILFVSFIVMTMKTYFVIGHSNRPDLLLHFPKWSVNTPL